MRRSEPIETGPTRRALLARAGAGAVAAGLVAPLVGAEPAEAQPPAAGDASVLADVLVAEQVMVVAYRQAFRSQQLSSHSARALRALYTQERAHVRLLAAQLARLTPGGKRALQPPPDVQTAQRLLAAHQVGTSLTSLHDEGDALRLLLAAENMAIGAYFKAMAQLASAALQRLAAGLMASDAQHAQVLGALAHPHDVTQATPNPFVQGTS